MTNHLFQDELSYLHKVGGEFSRLNPKLALHLGADGEDPDVERLLEGFAFLTSRLREKMDEEAAEFTYSLISLLWPNFLRAFPSSTIMKLTPIEGKIKKRSIIVRGTTILSRYIEGISCPFRLTSQCVVYPLEIIETKPERKGDNGLLRIDFATLSSLAVQDIGLSDLRLTFAGDMPTRQMLYLWFGRYLKKATIVFPDGKRTNIDIKKHITPIGFSSDEAILPQTLTAFEGHRLLQEFFVFSDKFYGYDLKNIECFFAGRTDKSFSIELQFERALPGDVRIRPDSVRLYCVPAVNLFPLDADPLLIRHEKVSYRVRPHGPNAELMEIFSIDSIRSHYASDEVKRQTRIRKYEAFESFAHERHEGIPGEQVYFRSRARKSRRFHGFEHELSFVLHNSERIVPDEEAVSIQLTCFNRDLCHELAIGDIRTPRKEAADFVTYSNIVRPTRCVYPPLDGTLNWNLLSNLSLNYMSLLNRDALAAILAIYDYESFSTEQAERATKQRIEGILDLKTRPIDRFHKGLPVRGLHSEITLQERAFQTEGEMYLFAAVLARFFALYSTVNSFHELLVHGEENGEIYEWPARIGR